MGAGRRQAERKDRRQYLRCRGPQSSAMLRWAEGRCGSWPEWHPKGVFGGSFFLAFTHAGYTHTLPGPLTQRAGYRTFNRSEAPTEMDFQWQTLAQEGQSFLFLLSAAAHSWHWKKKTSMALPLVKIFWTTNLHRLCGKPWPGFIRTKLIFWDEVRKENSLTFFLNSHSTTE